MVAYHPRSRSHAGADAARWPSCGLALFTDHYRHVSAGDRHYDGDVDPELDNVEASIAADTILKCTATKTAFRCHRFDAGGKKQETARCFSRQQRMG
jgi:hypothetical protein